MIVKNETLNLEKCLSSLETIRKQVSSELIIIDTGSTDDTLDIAKKFTEHVYVHNWNNNFSDMRNISISYARGEWLMIIDADEEITNDAGIIKLFEDVQALQNYNTLFIKMKDHTSLIVENSYYEYVTPRFFRNDGEFHYEGSIHNQPMLKEPSYIIRNSALEHYGYNSDDEVLMDQKFNRTASMLQKELLSNPNDEYYLYQLSVIYRMRGKYDEALAEIKHAFQLIDNQMIDVKDIYIVKQYILSLKDFEMNKMVASLEYKFTHLIKNDIDLSYYYGDSLRKIGRTEDAILHYERYLELVKKYQKGEYNSYDLLDKVITVSLVDYTIETLSEMFFQLKRFEQAEKYYQSLTLNKLSKQQMMHYAECLMSLNHKSRFITLTKELLSNKDQLLIDALINAVETYTDKEKLPNNNEWVVACCAIDDHYDLLNSVRKMVHEGKIINADEMTQFFEIAFSETKLYYVDLLYFALENKKNILSVLSKQSTEIIMNIVTALNNRYENFKNYAIEMIESKEMLLNIRASACIEEVLLQEESLSTDMKIGIGIDFLINKIEQLYKVYKVDVIEKQIDYLKDNDYLYALINLTLLKNQPLENIKEILSSQLFTFGDVLYNVLEIAYYEIEQALSDVRLKYIV